MPSRLCFILHMLVETPAALSFPLATQSQLAAPSAEARLLLRSYCGLLMATNLIGLVFALQDSHGYSDADISGPVAGSLAFYHLFPIFRALARIRRRSSSGPSPSPSPDRLPPAPSTLGGPWVHVVVHFTCLVCFLATACGILQ